MLVDNQNCKIAPGIVLSLPTQILQESLVVEPGIAQRYECKANLDGAETTER